MRRLEASLPTGRALLALDACVALWVVTWIVMAIVVASKLQGLAELSDTVGTVGGAAETSGAALGALGELAPAPFDEALSGILSGPAAEIQEAGRSAQESGASSRERIETLTALLGLSIALIPSLPLLGTYLPARVGRAREARAIEWALRASGNDPAFQEFLARRAAQSLPYRRLREVSREPWRDLATGRFDRLAGAELERLGVSRERVRPG